MALLIIHIKVNIDIAIRWSERKSDKIVGKHIIYNTYRNVYEQNEPLTYNIFSIIS